MLSLGYMYMHADDLQAGNRSASAIEEDFNINTSMRLWDTSNFTIGYGYEEDKDFTDSIDEARTDSLFATFGWPFTKTYRFGNKLSLYPFLSYHSAARNAALRDRSVWTASMDGSYEPTEYHKFSIETLYRQDQDDDQQGALRSDEYRFLLTYKSLWPL